MLSFVSSGRLISGVWEDYWLFYSGCDVYCGNMFVILLDDLVVDGLFEMKDLLKAYGGSENVDFGRVAATNELLIVKVVEKLFVMVSGSGLKGEYDVFCVCVDVKVWLDFVATFDVIDSTSEFLGKYWWDWFVEYCDCDLGVFVVIESEKVSLIEFFKVM